VLFPTITFAVFFLVVWPGAWAVAPWPRARQGLLLVASWFFYAWWDERFLALLVATIVLAHLGGRAVAATADRPGLQRAALATGIALHLGILGWYKYYGFFAASLTSALDDVGVEIHPPLLQVVLPVGISFFTFQAVSYLVEVRRQVLAPASLLEVATWISFFPTVASGPITRASELVPQLRARPEPRIEANRAFALIIRGLFKKVVLASFLGSTLADDVFDSPAGHSGPEVLAGIYAYAVQLYVDFSGYTDMAVGIALLLGFRLPENFDRPYAAASVTEFWTRWHMTLSRWLRDFVFTPLAHHSRPTTVATCRNLLVVMLLAGLWHGAAWTFVAFGAVHGVALALERVARQHRRATGRARREGAGWQLGRWLVTFHVVCLGWVFFRSESLAGAGEVLARLGSGWTSPPEVSALLAATVAAVLAAQFVPRQLVDDARAVLVRAPAAAAVALAAVALLVVDVLGPEGVAPFIYFGF
jgi:D-alanyl-lipoteichoic acid acyltransferase DltB (MBOAT superfamily)